MTRWDVTAAAELAKRQEIAASHPPCPYCGASVDINSIHLVDVTTYGDLVPQFIWDESTTVECSKRCYTTNPRAYIAAVTPTAVVKIDKTLTRDEALDLKRRWQATLAEPIAPPPLGRPDTGGEKRKRWWQR